MGTRMDPFWVPPEDFGPPRDLDEIAAQLQDLDGQLGRLVWACHAVRPRVNMRPTMRELPQLQRRSSTPNKCSRTTPHWPQTSPAATKAPGCSGRTHCSPPGNSSHSATSPFPR